MHFEALDLDPDVLSALHTMGYSTMTPVQEQAVPKIIEGKDVIALAETGSGKTAACAIPVSHLIDTKNPKIQGLILVPTRELAFQYATEAQKIGKEKGIKTFALLGGEDMDMQRAKLKDGVHVLIATPGRLIDFIYSRQIDLSHVCIAALDEADQMLGMGFLEDLEFILDCLVQTHQTLLFSATMPKEIKEIAVTRMRAPEILSLISDKPSPSQLEHYFMFCSQLSAKHAALLKLLEDPEIKQAIIFGNSRREVEQLFHLIKKKEQGVEFLHGGLMQTHRSSITQKFAKGKLRFLIASDIAARGLDFSHVTHVINLHFPHDQESYVHRSGRAGRSGRKGTCITLIAPKEFSKLRRLLATLEKEPLWIGEAPHNFSMTAPIKNQKKKFSAKRPRSQKKI